MKIGIEALTDTQRLALASGKALATELGLTELDHTNPLEVKLTDGQTVVIATPYGTKVGVIKAFVRQFGNDRVVEYVLNREILLKTHECLRGDKWERFFAPSLNLSANSTLYVSTPAS